GGIEKRQQRGTRAHEAGEGTAVLGSQTIRRAFQLLRGVVDAGASGGRLSDLAVMSKLNTATAHRILGALAREGLIAQDSATRRYRLSAEFFRLAEAAREIDLRGALHPILERTVEKFHDSVYLSVQSGKEVVCIDSVMGRTQIRVVPFDIGSRRPLGIGAAGLAVLAAEPPERAEAIMREHAPHYAKFGQKVTAIRRMVEDCRRLGYSYNPGHFVKGVSGLGVPAYDSRGRLIGVINLTAISERLTAAARRREIVAFLRKELATVRL
ncbi:MAG: helix-turn-helix domain-containing protein, partial [Alphaproteobacteria bacterium]|nr:helix-turn-helix domain-containing protein [Alphaproteobacteria bacterium]